MKRTTLCAALVFAAAVMVQPASAQTALDMNDGAGLCAAGKFASIARRAGSDNFAGKTSSVASAEFDAIYYHLELDTDPGRDPVLTGRVRVSGRALSPMQSLVLDLQQPMVVDSVLAVTGEHLAYTHAGDVLSIDLAGSAGTGSAIDMDIFYGGNPSGGGFGTFAYGTRSGGDPFLWTLSEPYGASAWWPNKDHPSDKADSVRITVRVPSDMRAGSNGLLVAEFDDDDGTIIYDWLHKYPISTYLVSLAEGRYDVFEQTYVRPADLVQEFGSLSLPILHYAYQNTSAYEGINDQSGWKRVLEVLPVFEDWFGPYPFPEEKYGHAHVTFGGGMEHQTMTSMGNFGTGLVAHELAHMWYGDLVTARTWPHLWLQEGFATLGEVLFWESDPDRFQGTYEYVSELYYNRARNARGTLVLEDTSSVGNMFAGARVYSKGYIVLRMLRRIVGDTTFKTILRAYAAEEGLTYANAVTADFKRVVERESGLDLSAFFEQWVTSGTGFPEYSVDWWDRSTDGEYFVALELRQNQTSLTSNVSVFKMPVDIVVHTESGVERFTVENDQRLQAFGFSLQDRPLLVEIDPERWILHAPEVVVNVHTETPLETILSLSAYPNPARDVLSVNILMSQPDNARIRLFDSLGRPVMTLTDGVLLSGPHEETYALPTSLAAGSYMLELRTGSQVVRRPVIILR